MKYARPPPGPTGNREEGGKRYAAARLGESMARIIPAQTRMREVGKKLRANRHAHAHRKCSSDIPMSLGVGVNDPAAHLHLWQGGFTFAPALILAVAGGAFALGVGHYDFEGDCCLGP
jgi:hypothetical protein